MSNNYREARMTTVDYLSQVSANVDSESTMKIEYNSSQMGGLMGLCMGCSVISFIEVIYWITYRLARNARNWICISSSFIKLQALPHSASTYSAALKLASSNELWRGMNYHLQYAFHGFTISIKLNLQYLHGHFKFVGYCICNIPHFFIWWPWLRS